MSGYGNIIFRTVVFVGSIVTEEQTGDGVA